MSNSFWVVELYVNNKLNYLSFDYMNVKRDGSIWSTYDIWFDDIQRTSKFFDKDTAIYAQSRLCSGLGRVGEHLFLDQNETPEAKT